MTFSKLLRTFSLSAAIFIVTGIAISNVIFIEKKSPEKINLNAINSFIANANSFHETSTNEEEKKIRFENLVISSVEKEIKKSIIIEKNNFVKAKNKIAKTPEKQTFKSKEIVYAKEKTTNPVKQKDNKTQTEELDLSAFEINNSDTVFVGAFESEKISLIEIKLSNYEETKFANNETSNTKDEVNLKESSVVNTKNETIENITDNKELISENDDMPMFEYSKPETTSNETGANTNTYKSEFDKKLYDRPISKTVLNVIKREVGIVKKPEAKNQNREINQDVYQPIVSNKEASALLASKSDEYSDEGFADLNSHEYSEQIKKMSNQLELKKQTGQALTQTINVNIQAMAVDMNTHKTEKAFSFEFIPDYDRNERIYDQGNGEIKIEAKTNDESVQTGIINQREMMPTRIEILMENHTSVIPLITEKSYGMILDKRAISSNSSVLVSLANKVKDADIDREFGAKIFLDKNFKETDKEKAYIMFLGVRSGNILLRYQTENFNTEKIIYVGENEIYFEEPRFRAGNRESFEITTRNILSSRAKGLNVNGSDVKVFNSNITSKKEALNVYQLKLPGSTLGSRTYLEINNENNSIIVGIGNRNNIEISSKEYVQKILEFNQMPSLDNGCLIQLNYNKEIESIKVSGKNMAGDMLTESTFIDGDGNLSKDNMENAEKVFIFGENEGMISGLINYKDGSNQSIKSYCSNGTYLIEEL
jgi:hypothetical protein